MRLVIELSNRWLHVKFLVWPIGKHDDDRWPKVAAPSCLSNCPHGWSGPWKWKWKWVETWFQKPGWQKIGGLKFWIKGQNHQTDQKSHFLLLLCFCFAKWHRASNKREGNSGSSNDNSDSGCYSNSNDISRRGVIWSLIEWKWKEGEKIWPRERLTRCEILVRVSILGTFALTWVCFDHLDGSVAGQV